MSDKELRRINVIQSVVEKRMRRRDAVQQLALTERQTQRLMGPTLAAENLEQHGKPLAFYSDKHGIFRVNVHSNIRCSTNWNVSTKGKSLITNVLGLF
ncbi:hypothetical protein I4K34_002467 [Salmonella enterica]|nr:hypothetical protein [Salmonella enterica]